MTIIDQKRVGVLRASGRLYRWSEVVVGAVYDDGEMERDQQIAVPPALQSAIAIDITHRNSNSGRRARSRGKIDRVMVMRR